MANACSFIPHAPRRNDEIIRRRGRRGRGRGRQCRAKRLSAVLVLGYSVALTIGMREGGNKYRSRVQATSLKGSQWNCHRSNAVREDSFQNDVPRSAFTGIWRAGKHPSPIQPSSIVLDIGYARVRIFYWHISVGSTSRSLWYRRTKDESDVAVEFEMRVRLAPSKNRLPPCLDFVRCRGEVCISFARTPCSEQRRRVGFFLPNASYRRKKLRHENKKDGEGTLSHEKQSQIELK